MFDIMAKKKWFFAFSLLLTIPGLIFILLTPITGGAMGLKFSIDYTGGTLWEFKFVDPNVTPDQVKAVFVEQGLADTTVVRTEGGVSPRPHRAGRAPRPRGRTVAVARTVTCAFCLHCALVLGCAERVRGCLSRCSDTRSDSVRRCARDDRAG